MTAWQSPIGWLDVHAKKDGILSVTLGSEQPMDSTDHPLSVQCIAQLQEYFAGKRTAFDLPLAPMGTPFQQKVWHAAQSILYGTTRSYAALAMMIGRPAAARAVGNALKQNPLAILIPCHRIIPADGSLGGYAWGKERKEAVLMLEGALY